MIITKQQQLIEEKPNMRGGEGTPVLHHLLPGALPERLRIFSEIRLAPGASIGKHVHEGEAELFYFIEGSGQVEDDDRVVQVQAGDTMLTASGHSHSVKNTGNTDLAMLAVIVKD